MSNWKRILRGMIGMGLTFAAVAGSLAALFAVFSLLFLGGGRELLILVVGSTMWSFMIGVVFSGALAFAARHLPLEKLSLPKVTGLGVLGGLAIFGLLAINGASAWTVDAAISNLVILTVLGGGAAAGSLLAARASPTLTAGDDALELEDGDLDRLESGRD